MPNVDGIQSTRLIRQMGYSAPIVALTAFSEESNVKECYDSGMDMFLRYASNLVTITCSEANNDRSKPIRRPALKQVLKKFAPIPEEAEGSPNDERNEAVATQKAKDDSKANGASVPPSENG